MNKMVRIGKKQLWTMDFILREFIITHSNETYIEDIQIAKNILNKIERELEKQLIK